MLARLERYGNTVRGRDFYAHIGVDIPLAWPVADIGDIALTDGNPARPTGRFAGSCRADEDAETAPRSLPRQSAPGALSRVRRHGTRPPRREHQPPRSEGRSGARQPHAVPSSAAG
ncbi:hypothetical protein [Sorangium sp. So ce861]|uniref:hypothetical protein n=1 Tax=Sorangium sp. So ce861 TaxID=3133323 RepID=UPI003F63FE35